MWRDSWHAQAPPRTATITKRLNAARRLGDLACLKSSMACSSSNASPFKSEDTVATKLMHAVTKFRAVTKQLENALRAFRSLPQGTWSRGSAICRGCLAAQAEVNEGERCFYPLRLLHSLHLLPKHLSDHLAVPTARQLP